MKVKIQIETETFVRFWLVVITFIGIIWLAYLSRTALIIIGAAAFLAIALNYPVTSLVKYIPGKSRVAATAAAFMIVVAFLAMIIFLVIPPIAAQTAKLVDAVPRMIEQTASQWDAFGQLVDKYHIQPQVDAAVESFRQNSTRWLTNIGGNVISGIGSVLSTAAAGILALVASFLMLIEGPAWMQRIWALYSDKKRLARHKRIVERMNFAVSGYVTGQLAVSGIGAVVAGMVVFFLALFVSEVPMDLTLPTVAIMFVLSLIPMFGTTLASILLALLLAFNSVPAAVIFLIAFFAYQQVENNIIYPTVQAKFVEMSPLAILVAVTMGVYLFGIAGGIISIPIAGVIKVLIEEFFYDKKLEQAGGKSKKKSSKKTIETAVAEAAKQK